MDFYKIIVKRTPDNRAAQDYVIYPEFRHINIKDLVVKGGVFFAYWDGEVWSNDVNRLLGQIDKECWDAYHKLKDGDPSLTIDIKSMDMDSSGSMNRWVNYCKKVTTPQPQFDSKILYSDYTPKREDYSTIQLSYSPKAGSIKSFERLTSVLYDQSEIDKITWALGALFTGEIAHIEKFLYLYGAKGTGKGTILKIINHLCETYISSIDLQTLTGTSEFATAGVHEVPILIDSDTKLDKIKKDTNLLKLTGHEEVLKRVMYQSPYPVVFHGLVVTASNDRFAMKNKDSGIVRRALVVKPSGRKVSGADYNYLMKNIAFEIPAIAQHCIDTFNTLGANYYDETVDVDMVAYADKIFDFIRENYLNLKDGVTLQTATNLYKMYLEDMGWDPKGAKRELKQSLGKYYTDHYPDKRLESGERVYNYFEGFRYDVVFPETYTATTTKLASPTELVIDQDYPGAFDALAADYPAQLTTEDGLPINKWANVKTTLKDLDSTELHFVRVPQNHIILDFDIKNSAGEKDYEMNLKAASEYPATYAEVSKSGGGIHLHYWYDGDISQLANRINDDIEVKIFTGNSSLRRKFVRCNDLEVAHIASGLPLKEEKTVLKDIENIVWTETKLRKFVESCFRKEHHGATKPELDFINKVLTDAKNTGVQYDLSNYQQDAFIFAMRSTHQKEACLKIVNEIPFSTIEKEEDLPANDTTIRPDNELYFYDVEVFPNLLIVCWKQYGENGERGRWINPTPDQIKWLLEKPLVGFFNRNYDNHIIYNRLHGASNIELYNQSYGLVNNQPGAKLQGAYNISYADLYEFHDIKMSLKKWEIKLGIRHDEFEHPWDQPLPEEFWERCADYCMHDVEATEAVFTYKKGQAAYTARKVLATLTGQPINAKTQTLAELFLFGTDKRPQDKFVWYDLAKEFPGYTFNVFRKPQSDYHGKNPSEGGYVFSKPGVYRNVGILDVRSLHPNSLIAMNYFGPYTPRFKAMVDCRVFVKMKDFEGAIKAFNDVDPALADKLRPYLQDESMAGDLAHALKIVINIVYGMTSAKYDNKFKSPLNIDNCVAKRGALFMMMLQEEVESKGYEVIHIKTDSIKIVDMDDAIKEYCMNRANEFGYVFEHEHTFDKLALTNKATLIHRVGWSPDPEEIGEWIAIGAQYEMPIVKKTLFTHEPIMEEDYFLFKQSTAPIKMTNKASFKDILPEDNDRFIGKNAEVYASHSGKNLYADRGETKAAVTGTKGYLWSLASEYKGKEDIDMQYYEMLVSNAVDDIFKKGDGNIIFEGTKWERAVEA